MNLKRMTDHLGYAGISIKGHFYDAAIASLLPRASASLVDDLDAFISTSLFFGIGLLVSLSVLILDPVRLEVRRTQASAMLRPLRAEVSHFGKNDTASTRFAYSRS